MRRSVILMTWRRQYHWSPTNYLILTSLPNWLASIQPRALASHVLPGSRASSISSDCLIACAATCSTTVRGTAPIVRRSAAPTVAPTPAAVDCSRPPATSDDPSDSPTAAPVKVVCFLSVRDHLFLFCLILYSHHPSVVHSCLFFSPPIGSIGALMLVWRIRGKIIRTALCCVVYDSCAQWCTHTWAVLTFCMLVRLRFLCCVFIYVYLLYVLSC